MPRTAANRPLGDALSEKQEELYSDRTARMLGFTVVKFSQPRRTMQTRGIPDRLYLHPIHRVAVWAEVKSEKGKLSEAQKGLHNTLALAGQMVVTGTANVVGQALVAALKQRSDSNGR
jgi:hypothetical protein